MKADPTFLSDLYATDVKILFEHERFEFVMHGTTALSVRLGNQIIVFPVREDGWDGSLYYYSGKTEQWSYTNLDHFTETLHEIPQRIVDQINEDGAA